MHPGPPSTLSLSQDMYPKIIIPKLGIPPEPEGKCSTHTTATHKREGRNSCEQPQACLSNQGRTEAPEQTKAN